MAEEYDFEGWVRAMTSIFSWLGRHYEGWVTGKVYQSHNYRQEFLNDVRYLKSVLNAPLKTNDPRIPAMRILAENVLNMWEVNGSFPCDVAIHVMESMTKTYKFK